MTSAATLSTVTTANAPVVRTAVTDMFGTRFPVVAGGLQFLANAEYVAGCAKAGIIGFMTANHLPDDDALRAEIRKAQDLCGDLPFGVNIAMLPKSAVHERIEQIVQVVADEGVRFVETAGRSPDPYLPVLQGAGIKVLHKVPGLRFAEKAQSVGVDMVTIVGWECGGHPGPNAVGSIVNAALAQKRLKIPYLIGGGIGHGSQLLAAMAMGASGVLMGTRFLVSSEIPAHDGYKAALCAATENDTTISLWSVRNNARSLINDTTRTVAELERANPDAGIEPLLPHVAGSVALKTYADGDTSRGMVYAGQALGFVQQSQPVAEIVETLIAEYTAARDHLQSIL
ncbi:NAD(P)H-dependent flavin oxidoreductase [Chachezhania antarctica]|uniref:NAD(P)H-dependent flavin oxidoreductase n=1 Tax=Chachezhania antarctica TaxID=2340860 RepID=UPI000EABAC1F|nr:nitronate monooxygenase [Chachezhania antarctica]